MTAFYNEKDPHAAQWLRPCQPLSVAGQRQGDVDQRHLWPAFHRLIAERRPATILGEQVAGKDGREWMAAVRADLEALGYAVGVACLPAAGLGAPHLRYRLFWVAHAASRRSLGSIDRRERDEGGGPQQPPGNGPSGLLAYAERQRVRGEARNDDGAPGEISGEVRQQRLRPDGGPGAATGVLADAQGNRCDLKPGVADLKAGAGIVGIDQPANGGRIGWPRPPNGFWSDADWIFCRDGKWRPAQSSILALAHGTSPRLGRMRATEEIDGDAGQGSTAAFLRSVREEVGEEAFFKRIGGLLSVPYEEILQSGVHGAGNGERGLPQSQSQSVQSGQVSEAGLRDVREGGGTNARPSCGREPKKQRAIELDDVMSFLSQTAASPLIDGAAFRSGGSFEGKSRTGMLRGYGNAVVLPVATAFVEACIATLEAA